VRKEVGDMISDLQLVDKSKIQAQRLSGGMKRKLRSYNPSIRSFQAPLDVLLYLLVLG